MLAINVSKFTTSLYIAVEDKKEQMMRMMMIMRVVVKVGLKLTGSKLIVGWIELGGLAPQFEFTSSLEIGLQA